MPKISALFTLQYGHSLELNRLDQSENPDSIHFVGRAARNNGVTARVAPQPGLSRLRAAPYQLPLGDKGVLE